MKTKEHIYAVIGGCAGAVFALAFTSFFPIGVHSQSDTFGEITCTGLKVVNPNGKALIELENGDGEGFIQVKRDDDSRTMLWLSPTPISLLGSPDGGVVITRGSAYFTGKNNDGSVRIKIDEHGGEVYVEGTGEEPGAARMAIGEYGGSIAVFGRGGAGNARAVMSVNEYGNSGIGTWDKNGYRLK